jgi:hypothetical protein
MQNKTPLCRGQSGVLQVGYRRFFELFFATFFFLATFFFAICES